MTPYGSLGQGQAVPQASLPGTPNDRVFSPINHYETVDEESIVTEVTNNKHTARTSMPFSAEACKAAAANPRKPPPRAIEAFAVDGTDNNGDRTIFIIARYDDGPFEYRYHAGMFDYTVDPILDRFCIDHGPAADALGLAGHPLVMKQPAGCEQGDALAYVGSKGHLHTDNYDLTGSDEQFAGTKNIRFVNEGESTKPSATSCESNDDTSYSGSWIYDSEIEDLVKGSRKKPSEHVLDELVEPEEVTEPSGLDISWNDNPGVIGTNAEPAMIPRKMTGDDGRTDPGPSFEPNTDPLDEFLLSIESPRQDESIGKRKRDFSKELEEGEPNEKKNCDGLCENMKDADIFKDWGSNSHSFSSFGDPMNLFRPIDPENELIEAVAASAEVNATIEEEKLELDEPQNSLNVGGDETAPPAVARGQEGSNNPFSPGSVWEDRLRPLIPLRASRRAESGGGRASGSAKSIGSHERSKNSKSEQPMAKNDVDKSGSIKNKATAKVSEPKEDENLTNKFSTFDLFGDTTGSDLDGDDDDADDDAKPAAVAPQKGTTSKPKPKPTKPSTTAAKDPQSENPTIQSKNQPVDENEPPTQPTQPTDPRPSIFTRAAQAAASLSAQYQADEEDNDGNDDDDNDIVPEMSGNAGQRRPLGRRPPERPDYFSSAPARQLPTGVDERTNQWTDYPRRPSTPPNAHHTTFSRGTTEPTHPNQFSSAATSRLQSNRDEQIRQHGNPYVFQGERFPANGAWTFGYPPDPRSQLHYLSDLDERLEEEHQRRLDGWMTPPYSQTPSWVRERELQKSAAELRNMQDTSLDNNNMKSKWGRTDPHLRIGRELPPRAERKREQKHKLKSVGGGGDGDDSPPSSSSDEDEDDDNSSNDSDGDSKPSKNNNDNAYSPSIYDSDVVTSSSSGSNWSHDNDDSSISSSDAASTSSEETSSLTGRKTGKKKTRSKPKLYNKKKRKGKKAKQPDFNERYYLAPKMLARMTQAIMKFFTYLPDSAGQSSFTPTGDVDHDSQAFFDFLQLLNDVFCRWPPLAGILRDTHRNGSIHRVRREFDEAAYAATYRLFPQGVIDSFVGKEKSVVEALKLMRRKYANGGRDAKMSRTIQLMRTKLGYNESATEFIERTIRIQRQGIAQNAPISNRELKNHILYTLKNSRKYRVDAAALEGTSNANGKKLTVRRIRRHFAKLDRRTQLRNHMLDISNASNPDTFAKKRQKYLKNKAYAYAANMGPQNPYRASTPLVRNQSNQRNRVDYWKGGKERVAVMRPPNKGQLPSKVKMANAVQHSGDWRTSPDIVCYFCNEKGHIMANCRRRKDKGYRGFKDGSRNLANAKPDHIRSNQSVPLARPPQTNNNWGRKQPPKGRFGNGNNRPQIRPQYPPNKAAMQVDAKFEALPEQNEYLCAVVADVKMIDDVSECFEHEPEYERERSNASTPVIETDECMYLPTGSSTELVRNEPFSNEPIRDESMKSSDPLTIRSDFETEREETATLLRDLNASIQQENMDIFRKYVSKTDDEASADNAQSNEIQEHVAAATDMRFSPSIFDYESGSELNADLDPIPYTRMEMQSVPLTPPERISFLRDTLMNQPPCPGSDPTPWNFNLQLRRLMRDSEIDPSHPLFTHTSSISDHATRCNCVKCRPDLICPCGECTYGKMNPWLTKQVYIPISATAASTELNDLDVADILENQEIPDELRCLQDVDSTNITQPTEDPRIQLDESTETTTTFTHEEEENIIRMYESGYYMNDFELRNNYISIIARRNAEYAANPTNQSQESSSHTSTTEMLDDDNESLSLAIDEDMETIREHFLHDSDHSNPNNDGDNHYCGLVYTTSLKPPNHTYEAEHFEYDGQLQTTVHSFWTHHLDTERMNELESSQADIILYQDEFDNLKDYFTLEEVSNLRGDISDEEEEDLNETAASALIECGNYAAVNKIYHGPSHSLEHGWLIDSGASCHMTPFKSDLKNTKMCRANVTVADGSKIHSDLLGDVTILLPTNEDEYNAARITLTKVLYVPGLNRRLFSVPTFTKLPGHEMTFYENKVHITLPDGKTADVPNDNEKCQTSIFANPATTRKYKPYERRIKTRLWIKENEAKRKNKKRNIQSMKESKNDQDEDTEVNNLQKNPQQTSYSGINHSLPRSAAVDLDLLHDRLGHRKTTAIIAASHHRVWADTYCIATRDHFCTSCPIATISRAKRPRTPSNVPNVPLARVYIDTVPNPTNPGITVDSSWSNLLIVVDHHSRFLWIDGMTGKTSHNVINSLKRFIARFGQMREIRSDAGSEFISEEFETWCTTSNIRFNAAAPARQHQNGICERHWASTSNMARKMLIRAHLNKKFLYHAIKYAAIIHNVLPVKGVTRPNGDIATPYELFHGRKPNIKNLRVFGCPAVRKRYSASEQNTNSQQLSRWNLQKGIRCIFIGLPENRAGWLFYSSNTRLSTSISYDAVFDESFSTPIALSLPPFTGGVPYRNINTNALPRTPLYDGQMEMTGDITTIPPSTFETTQPLPPTESDEPNLQSGDEVKEGEENDSDADMVPHQNIRHSTRSNAAIFKHKPGSLVTHLESANTVTSTPDSVLSPPPRLTRFMNSLQHPSAASATVAPQGLYEITNDDTQAHETEDATINASDCFPEPMSVKQIYRMDEPLKSKWMKSIATEAKVIFDNNTFNFDDVPLPGEQVLPVKTVFKTKINADGSLNKLKTRIVVRGDLQKLRPGENAWSPTASMRLLKTFVASAAQEGKEIKQADFIAAFIQAKVRERVFVRLSEDLAAACPEYVQWLGRPLRLEKGLYGLTLCGKYWHIELLEYLLEIGFKQSKVDPSLMIKRDKDGNYIKLINYVDDMLYYGSSDEMEKQFVKDLRNRFNVTEWELPSGTSGYS